MVNLTMSSLRIEFILQSLFVFPHLSHPNTCYRPHVLYVGNTLSCWISKLVIPDFRKPCLSPNGLSQLWQSGEKKTETYLRSYVLSKVYHTDDNIHLVLEKECYKQIAGDLERGTWRRSTGLSLHTGEHCNSQSHKQPFPSKRQDSRVEHVWVLVRT